MRRKLALVLAFTMLFTGNVFAGSYNRLNKITTIRKDAALSGQYLKIIPYDEVETGSSIIITVKNAKVMDQERIDDFYQYSKYNWTSQPFWSVMPTISTNELPYRIYRRGSHEMEIKLINVPEEFTDASLYRVNRTVQKAMYNIPMPLIGETGGTIEITINNNSSSISSCTLSGSYVYDKKTYLAEKYGTSTYNPDTQYSDSVNVDEVTESTTEETTETTTVLTSTSSGSNAENSAAAVEKENIVDVSDNQLISVRGISKILKKDDEYSNLIWDGDTKTVSIIYKGKLVKFTSGANVMSIDGEEYELDEEQTAEIVNDRMYVPLGVLCRSLGITLTTSFFSSDAIPQTEEDANVTDDEKSSTKEVSAEEETEQTTEVIEESTEETTETTTDEATVDTDEETSEDTTEVTTEDDLVNSDDIIYRGKHSKLPSNVDATSNTTSNNS